MTQISFGNLPGTSALFLDYLYNWAKVRRFYRHSHTFDSILAFGRQRQSETLPHRERLCRALAEQQVSWGGTTDSVDRLAAGAVAVVAGQQPGLFTGPNYAILKAITALKLSAALTKAGLQSVPVFWIGAEDHDHEEIESAYVLDRDSALKRLQVDLSNEYTSPVGWLQFKDDVQSAIDDCLSSLPQSEFQPELRDALEKSYLPGSSPIDSFARMMTRFFAGSGLIIVNPLHPELKAVSQPMLTQIVKRNADLRQAVLNRSREITDAGYHAQVKVDTNFTGLFALRGRSRQLLRPEEIETDAMLSPNVLVRPFVQDSIFPNVALIAGPAEIAYLAQAGPVYETFGRQATPVFPRISATVLEARVTRGLRKYDLQFADVFQGKEFMKRRAVEHAQGADIFAKVKRNLSEHVESLRATVNTVDPTLAGALDTAKQKILYQVDTLETKFVNAETRRNEVMEKQLDLIWNSIFPDKKLQERVLTPSSFVARYGLRFIRHLEEAVTLETTQHQIVEI